MKKERGKEKRTNTALARKSPAEKPSHAPVSTPPVNIFRKGQKP
jgi:hypothetical protein